MRRPMINTRLLMASSGAAMAVLGAALTFLPQEIAKGFAISPAGALPIFFQLLGALYLAYGMLNWIAKANPMGGIYGRPIGLANMVHFTVGALALARELMTRPPVASLLALAATYVVFAVLFARVVFGPPPFAKAR